MSLQSLVELMRQSRELSLIGQNIRSGQGRGQIITGLSGSQRSVLLGTIYDPSRVMPVSYTHLDVYKRQVVRARELADRLNCQIAIVDKRRPRPNLAEVMNIIGEVAGKTAILLDDMIDTGGTIVNAAKALMEKGAVEVYACCTHAVFSHPAPQILQDSPLKEVVVTDSIHLPPEKQFPKLTVLSVAPLFAEAIRRIYEERPVSHLFV